MRPLLLSITFIAVLLSCKKDNDEEIDLLACTDIVQNDTVQLAAKLIGSWKLVSQACPLGNTKANVTVTFTSGREYELRKDGALVSNGHWSFSEWGSAWSLKTDNFTAYLFGSINFCEGKLVFIGQPLDGCNNIYKKSS